MKAFYHFLLLVMLLITVCSCKDDNEEPTPKQPTSSITVEEDDTHPVLPQEGGTVSIPFTATGNWTASLMNDRAEGWLTIAPASGKAGDVLLSVSAQANGTYDERNATIILKCGTVTKNIVLTQKQKDAILVSTSKYEIPVEGGEINVEVQANVTFEVEVKSDWIKQTDASNTRALSSSILNFTVDTNDTGEKREGKIIVKSGDLSETITVYQGYGDFVILTKRDFTLPEEGGVVDIEIKSTVNYDVKILDNVDWITEIQTRAVSTHTRHYEVVPNENYDSREARIVFYSLEDESLADTVSIYQMYKGAILVARNEYQFGIQGGNLNLTVSSNLEFDVIVSDDWIQQIRTRGLVDTELRFTIAENTEGRERESTITVKDKNSDRQQVVTIKQTSTNFEREALIALYKATNGDNWTNNENWCSDKPIEEWYGIEMYGVNVVEIKLRNNNLSGTIPQELSAFKNLIFLDLGENNLSGEIPSIIGELGGLLNLCLDSNQLTGKIPNEINQLASLNVCDLSNNKLSGEIPNVICTLKDLAILMLDNNQLTGKIPNEINQLTSLKVCDLSNNKLSGEIPNAICALKDLTTLMLGNNQLTGEIPSKIGQMLALSYFSIGNYDIGSEGGEVTVGEETGRAKNQISGFIPIELCRLPNLRTFDAVRNRLSGNIPNEIWSLPSLTSLLLDANQLTGSISSEIRNAKFLEQLWLSNNLLTGKLPEELCELSCLEELQIGNFDCMIDGTVFQEHNHFEGNLPQNIGHLYNLKILQVGNTGLTGVLPQSLYQLQAIENIELGNVTGMPFYNSFGGELSKEIGKLKTLSYLNISHNNLEGNLPEELADLPNLRGVLLSAESTSKCNITKYF